MSFADVMSDLLIAEAVSTANVKNLWHRKEARNTDEAPVPDKEKSLQPLIDGFTLARYPPTGSDI